jgi:catechol 2,3-dioxygenase-like lactoylglutathione lyase family enzyme
MAAATEVRRFLHCNYNCRDVDNLERFYIGLLGLRTVMRSEGGKSAGEPFGLYGDTEAKTVFLYDHRGGRYASSFEIVQWKEPRTWGSVYPEPWYNGIQSAAFSCSDLEAAATTAVSLGGRVVRKGPGWLLLRDPEDVFIELFQADGPSEARYLRMVCSDMERTMEWWSMLGFTEGSLTVVPGGDIYPADGDRHITEERSMVATDDDEFGIVFTTWSGDLPIGPTYGMPYHQGLYRMAMAVDDVHASHAALLKTGMPRQYPYTFQLPGTKLTDGLTMMFIRDPDLMLVELVDRPRIGRRP